MRSKLTNPLLSSFFLTALGFIFVNATAACPSKTFKHYNVENHNFVKERAAEYGDYRCYMDISNDVFSLCFKNAKPNVFTLSILMGNLPSYSYFHWVWDANRATPVGENATLTFGCDGNLVLADADGTVAWQTNTANKGVEGIKILPNGNMVLYDSEGSFVWQSFDFPSDTLLIGQSLRRSGVYKLVSRRSNEDIREGPYSMVLEPRALTLSYKGEHSPAPNRYYIHEVRPESLETVTFDYEPDVLNHCSMYLDYHSSFTSVMARIKWNCSLSFLRMDPDGNVRIYSFYNKYSNYDAWEVTFTLLSKDSRRGDECLLPEKCGVYGLCEKSQCVACPGPKGLRGWWDGCRPKKLFSCKEFKYYKIEGVNHYSSRESGIGPMKEADCERKCSVDCNCMGYFYHTDTSKCWIAHDLKTLKRVWTTTHVGYIKTPL